MAVLSLRQARLEVLPLKTSMHLPCGTCVMTYQRFLISMADYFCRTVVSACTGCSSLLANISIQAYIFDKCADRNSMNRHLKY